MHFFNFKAFCAFLSGSSKQGKDLSILISFLILGACDVARNYLSDILEFLSDVHTLSKVKSNVKGTVGLNEDTLGGTLKASLAQYLALEISKGNIIFLT